MARTMARGTGRISLGGEPRARLAGVPEPGGLAYVPPQADTLTERR